MAPHRQPPERGVATSHAFDDAEVAHRAVAQGARRFLVARAVVRGDGLGTALVLDDHRALLETLFIDLGGHWRSHQELAAVRHHRRAGELGVGGELLGIFYRVVSDDAVGLGHGAVPWSVSGSLAQAAMRRASE